MFVHQLLFSHLLEGESLIASGRFVRIVLATLVLIFLLALRIIEIILIYILTNMYFLIFSGLDESILEECLQHLEKQLESSQARKAMEEFFSER